MGWVQKITQREACKDHGLPDVEPYAVLSIWECDNCHKRFMIEWVFTAEGVRHFGTKMPQVGGYIQNALLPPGLLEKRWLPYG